MKSVTEAGLSKSLARHKDEEHAKCGVDDDDESQRHPRAPPVQVIANEGFADAVEGHEGVFGETKEREDWVEHELMSDEEIDAEGEGKNELY